MQKFPEKIKKYTVGKNNFKKIKKNLDKSELCCYNKQGSLLWLSW